MFIRQLILVFVVVALTTCATAGASRTRRDAGSFVRGVVGELAANRYGIAWNSLYPAQRAAIPEGHYVACERLTRIPAGHTVVKVLSVRSVRIRVAGGPRYPVPAFAVKLRITITSAQSAAHDTVVTTAHALPVASGWSWILSPKRFAADRRGDCGLPQLLPF